MKEDHFKILDKETLDDPEKLEQVLHELREFFGEPCLPASKYCKALTTWAHIQSENEKNEQFAQFYRVIENSIYKSCLLDRMIYGGEELRTEPCPVHKGVWSGISFGEGKCECSTGSCACTTGWLPNKKKEK